MVVCDDDSIELSGLWMSVWLWMEAILSEAEERVRLNCCFFYYCYDIYLLVVYFGESRFCYSGSMCTCVSVNLVTDA